MAKHFVILSSQRSGSTFVRIWLNQHSRIHSYGEVFLGHYRSSDGFRAYCDRHLMSKIQFGLHHSSLCKAAHCEVIPSKLVEGYLDTLLNSKSHPAPWTDIKNRDETKTREQKPVVGFKLMWNTLSQYTYLEKWLMEQRQHIIHIKRNNLLNAYVSQVRMKESKIAHSVETINKNTPVFVEVDSFINYVNDLLALQACYKEKIAKKSPILELSYEEIFSDLVRAKQKILGFLKVDDEDMAIPEMKKMSSSNISNNVENYDEIESRLSGTKYESFIVDQVR